MSEKIIKVCVDRVLPPDLALQAATAAIKENPANLPVVKFSPGMGALPMPPGYMAVSGASTPILDLRLGSIRRLKSGSRFSVKARGHTSGPNPW
jgi:hypothetical protein